MILKHQPIMITVTIPNPKFKKFPGLSDGEYPIYPTTKSFEFIQYIDGTKISQTIQRTQFPLIPGYAITGYKAHQGATFEQAILDLKSPAEGKGVGPVNPADAYVLLSRMKTRAGLLILRPFQKELLCRAPDAHMIREIARLQDVETRNTPFVIMDIDESDTDYIIPTSPMKRMRVSKKN